jgi:predicted N-acetyltransferase YhbS
MPAATNSFSREPNIRIRIAQDADAEAVAELINAAFIVERAAFDGNRIDTPGVSELMKKGTFLVAEEATALVGCVYIEVHDQRSYLGLLSVAPARQGTGTGRHLVSAGEEYSRNAGGTVMDLRIISPRAESLLPFYQHLGYSQTGTAVFPAGITTKLPCHYITMAKPLR